MILHKTQKLLYILPFILFLFSVSSADMPDVIVDHSSGNVNNPQVATGSNGRVYVVWEDTRNGSSDIYFNYSTDYGFNWQTVDIRLDTDAPGAKHSRSPRIACDDNGQHVYVVWEDQRKQNGSSDIYVNYSSDFGVTWQSSDKKLSSLAYAPPPQFPKIASDHTGQYVYVVWDDNYFNKSADYGATWLPQAGRISNTGGKDNQLTCSNSGQYVYVAWRASSELLFNYSDNYGNTWQSTDRRISNPGVIPYGLSLASDNNSNVYVTWHDGRGTPVPPVSPDIYFNSSSDYGNTWGATDMQLNHAIPGTTYSIWPEIACDNAGNVFVAWYDRRNGLGDIYLNNSSDAGSSWQSSDIRLDTDSAGFVDSGFPEIASYYNVSSGNSFVYVVWTDDQAGIGPGLYTNYSLDSGANWLVTNRKIGSEGYNIQMVTDRSRFYIVRENNNILFSEIAPLPVPPFTPTDPSPVNGAAHVSLTPVLSWRSGDANLGDTLTYDVYFGNTSPPTTLVSGNQPGTTYSPGALATLTTYYWQVVVKDGSGFIVSGPIWSFTTMSGPPQFLSFVPPDGAIDVQYSPSPTLRWTAVDPGDILVYDVFFGPTNPPALKVTNWTSDSYNPGSLNVAHATVYYWQVVARDNHGDQTVGPILSFATINNAPNFTYSSPTDGAINQSLTTTLAWTAADADPGDTNTLVFDVYFGTAPSPPRILTGTTDKAYFTGQLMHQTTYYWKIVARDHHGAFTELPVRSFTTLSQAPVFRTFSPPTSSKDISLAPTLSWDSYDPDPDDTLTYDVYFSSSTNVSGNGIPASDISPVASLNFGNVTVGSRLKKVTTIFNKGTAPLRIMSITPQSGSTEFSYIGTSTPFTIPVGDFEEITVKFSPVTEGPKSDVLHIYSNDPDEPDVTFNVSGNGGPVPDIEPIVSVAFGNVNVGSYLEKTTTIFNTLGTAPLTITGVTLPSGSTEFTYVGPSIPFTIPARESRDITVRLAPATSGMKNDVFHVFSNDPDEPDVTVDVSGNGASVADIGVIVSLDFGNVSVGNYFEKKTTIFNKGTAPLTITAIMPPSGSTEFTYTGTIPLFTIPVGEFEEIMVKFWPATEGPKSGVFHIYSNDPDEPDVTFNVSGNGGPVPDIEPIVSVAFGNVNVGSNLDKTTTIRNTGDAPLTITGITLPSGSTEFAYIGPTIPFTIPGHGLQDITIRFSPATVGPKNDIFHIYSNDPDEPDVTFSMPLMVSSQTNTSYQPGNLTCSTRYYWKVIARDHHGVITSTPILNFDTMSCPPQFNDFLPTDGTTNVHTLPTLSWFATDPDQSDKITYDIYLGTSPSPPLILANQSNSSFIPSVELLPLTLYYWKVIARDNHGVETVGSTTLSFTTGDPPRIISVSPNPCATGQVVTINGELFGDIQGTSKIRLGNDVIPIKRIITWSDTKIEFKVPTFPTWKRGAIKTKNLWVNVNNLISNKVPLTIMKR